MLFKEGVLASETGLGGVFDGLVSLCVVLGDAGVACLVRVLRVLELAMQISNDAQRHAFKQIVTL